MTRRARSWIGIGILAAVATALVLTGLRGPHNTGPSVHETRAVGWADPPGPYATGWAREQWIMANQPVWIQREWRAASCPPLRESDASYYYQSTSPSPSGGVVSLWGPRIQSAPTWWGWPVPPTGFPNPGQRGC